MSHPLAIPDIPSLDDDALQRATTHLTKLAEPQGTFGRLGQLAIQLAGMTGHTDWFPARRGAFVFAGDHGVTVNSLSAVPQSMTAHMVGQLLTDKAAINVLSRQMGARLIVVDAGVNERFKPRPRPLSQSPAERLQKPLFVQRKIAKGTADFTQQPAMTNEQATQALQLGMEVMQDEIRQGLDIAIMGQMGVGNAVSACAIIATLTGLSAAEVTGAGAGINNDHLTQKIALIESALALHAPPTENTLAKIGSFEIGGMAGAMLQAASHRIPILLDGLACTAAALIARQYNPDVTPYLLAGHLSAEPGHTIALRQLGLTPILDLEMQLGEGTGAILALPIISAAMRVLNEMGMLD